MQSFFTLIYVVMNRFSDEKIVVGVLANLDGIPHFAYADRKLAFALRNSSAAFKASVRKSFRLMDFDINKIKRGEEALSLFDAPYSKRLLKELTHKKRGIIQYSDLFEAKTGGNLAFDKLYKKFVGEEVPVTQKAKRSAVNFKARFKEFVNTDRFKTFTYNFKLRANNYPYIYKDMSVDLLRKTSYYTVFYIIDFSKSVQTIQVNISRFRMIVQSLQQQSAKEGLSSGRYYMVYESTSSQSKLDLITAIKKEQNMGYEIIRMTEMKDKV